MPVRIRRTVASSERSVASVVVVSTLIPGACLLSVRGFLRYEPAAPPDPSRAGGRGAPIRRRSSGTTYPQERRSSRAASETRQRLRLRRVQGAGAEAELTGRSIASGEARLGRALAPRAPPCVGLPGAPGATPTVVEPSAPGGAERDTYGA
ncbi:hypothetical protein GCM10017562_13180 [Streptomyces roseofulvus]